MVLGAPPNPPVRANIVSKNFLEIPGQRFFQPVMQAIPGSGPNLMINNENSYLKPRIQFSGPQIFNGLVCVDKKDQRIFCESGSKENSNVAEQPVSRDQAYKLSQMGNIPQLFDSKQHIGIFINS